MTEILIGYARVSTDAQDLIVQRTALTGLGVAPERVYVGQGRSGSNRDQPGLARALAACRAGDTVSGHENRPIHGHVGARIWPIVDGHPWAYVLTTRCSRGVTGERLLTHQVRRAAPRPGSSSLTCEIGLWCLPGTTVERYDWPSVGWPRGHMTKALRVPIDRLWALSRGRRHDTLVVTKLDRLARSLTDARDISAELAESGVRLSLGGSIHDPTDPVGRLLFNALAMVAEFESDLMRARTREGMAIAKEKGRLRGRSPKLSPAQERHLVELRTAGTHSIAELAELFTVGRATVYRAVNRQLAADASTPTIDAAG